MKQYTEDNSYQNKTDNKTIKQGEEINNAG